MYQSLIDSSIIFSLVLLIVVTGVFLLAQWKSDNSIMDIVYGPIFTVSGLVTIWLTGVYTPLTLLIVSLIGIWSVRLGIRIWRKNHGQPEDARYAAWRTLWRQQGDWYFVLRSYIQINLLQGFIIILVSLPLILSIAYSSVETISTLSWLTWLGLLIYICGLSFESIADYQLDQFIARKKAGTEPATLLKKGLFRYSRRPNYFGETLIWWGLAVMVLPLPLGYLGLISPLVITFIVTRVTGPMLEKIFLERNGDEYRQYMRETSYFIPLPPRKIPPTTPQQTVA
jgi:steroid 5-alpha reductase family enzyme